MSRHLVWALLVVCAGLASADEVWLKNGNIITGEIVVERSDRVILETAGGKMTIMRDQIDKVVRKGAQPPPPPEPPKPPDPVPPTTPEGTEPKPPDPVRPPDPVKPPDPVTPPTPGDGANTSPRPAVKAENETQAEFLDKIGKFAVPSLPEADQAALLERLSELSYRDLDFAFMVFDAGPINRSLQVLKVITTRKDNRALPMLEARLASDTPAYRAAIVAALGAFAGDEQIEILRERVGREEPSVQAAILEQFERRGYVQATNDILPLLTHPQEAVRNRALAAVRSFAKVKALPDGTPYNLAAALADAWEQGTDPALGVEYLRLLSEMGGARVTAVMQKALSSNNAAEREVAAAGIGRIGFRGATEDLLSLAEGDNVVAVRLAAIRAIEQLKDPGATERLIGLLAADDAEVVAAAHRALKVITNQTLPKSHDDWAAWWASQH